MAQPIPLIWDFDKNKFIKMGGSGGGGVTINAEESGTPYEQLSVDNNTSTGLAVVKTTISNVVVLVDSNIEGIDLGTLGINIRMRLSNISYVGNALIVKTYYMKNETSSKKLLTTTYIKASDFNVANTYENIGIICNFIGETSDEKLLNISISTVSGYSGTIGFDYIKISTALPGIYSLPTIQS